MFNRWSLIWFLLISGLGCAKTCQKSTDNPADAKEQGEAAAVVNGHNISLSKLDELHKHSIEQMQKAGQQVQLDLDRKMRGGILRKMIDDEILRQKADGEGIKVDRFERTQALEQYKARLGGAPGAVNQKLPSLSDDQLAESAVNDLIRDKLIAKLSPKIVVSEDEINSYFEANKKMFTMPEMVHARHILLKVANTDPPEKAELVLKKAQSVLQEAKTQAANFEALVQKYSEGPSVKQNGDLGFFARGRMVKEFEDAAFNAPLKTPVGPIKTDFGYHIIYVEEKSPVRSATVPEVRDRIVESITRNKQARQLEDILAPLKKSAKLRIIDYSLTDQEYAGVSKGNRVAADKGEKE